MSEPTKVAMGPTTPRSLQHRGGNRCNPRLTLHQGAESECDRNCRGGLGQGGSFRVAGCRNAISMTLARGAARALGARHRELRNGPNEPAGQAIRYAAMVSTMTFTRAVEVFQAYLDRGGADRDAREVLLEFLDWDEPREEDFARDVRIVLVAADFSKELTTAVLWLNERDLDIRCVRLKP